jgi:SAM-dependent methyltransferase
MVYGDKVHQITPHTAEDRYPELFDMAANLAPEATRILSFGCSTGEELTAIRNRFPSAEIVGVEINPRSRRIAARRVMPDKLACVVGPNGLEGGFDVIFALAVLQWEPHKVAEMELGNLGRHYPFNRFDAAVCDLAGRLRPGGLLCVTNAQYPVELSSVSDKFEAVFASPEMMPPLFGTDGRLLGPSIARTIFRKRP